jgi:hypothetical protein
MPRRERRADRTACIAGSRLHPDVLEGAVLQHLAIGNAIERDASRETECAQSMLARQRASQPQHHLLGHGLDRGGDVHVELCQQVLARIPSRRSKQRVEALVRHGQSGTIVEIAEVQPECPVVLDVDQMIEND